MRVNNKDNEVAVEWNGMWLDHMAFRSMAQWSKIGINSSHKCHLKRHHLPPISNHPPRLCADMNSRDNLTTAPIHHSLPLQRLCPQATAAPSSRTTTERRSHLLCCIDFDPRIHFIESLDCHLVFHSASAASPSAEQSTNSTEPLHHSEPNPERNSQTSEANMPRMRHRMRSRRGGSRGSLNRPHHSPVSDSTSSLAEQTTGCYPNTRSGRGHSQSYSLHSMPPASPPSEFPSIFASPPKGTPFNPQQHLQNAQFTFCSSLNKPIIFATLSIFFHEMEQPIEGKATAGGGRTKAIGEQATEGGGHTKAKLDMAQTRTHGARNRQTEK